MLRRDFSDLFGAITQDWLDEFERVQLLRQKHGD